MGSGFHNEQCRTSLTFILFYFSMCLICSCLVLYVSGCFFNREMDLIQDEDVFKFVFFTLRKSVSWYCIGDLPLK